MRQNSLSRKAWQFNLRCSIVYADAELFSNRRYFKAVRLYAALALIRSPGAMRCRPVDERDLPTATTGRPLARRALDAARSQQQQ
eukprot:926979-Prymnesium_polylepis.1